MNCTERDLKSCTLCSLEENDWDSRPVKGAQRIEKVVQKSRWKNTMYWNSVGPQGERRRNFLSLYSMTIQGQRHIVSYKSCSIVPMIWFHFGRLPWESIAFLYITFLMWKTMSWIIHNHLTHSFWSNIHFGWEQPVLYY